jgi:signal transduction histidine kinase
LPHIFDMFYRANETAAGSGLGLYIVKESLNKLGGEIMVDSTPKDGSTFTVILSNNSEPA